MAEPDQRLHELVSSITPQTAPEELQETWNHILNHILAGGSFLVPAQQQGIPILTTMDRDAVEAGENPPEQRYVPVFTTGELAQRVYPGATQESLMVANLARLADFTQRIEGFRGVLINPNPRDPSPMQLALQAEEIQRMVSHHQASSAGAETRKVKQVAFRQPQDYPVDLADDLRALAESSLPEVQALWLVEAQLDGRASYLVIVDVAPEHRERVVAQLGQSSQKVRSLPFPAGFGYRDTRVGSDIAAQIQPFYRA